ncbi:MAG: GGDEF domain-containing protein [Halomonas sp.]|uniref:GGDEF domain-containing protein n=1 Tax=Halomonas sp. TaxID=1486246 RepID=UPI002ACE4F59|nr:GGDEF domain-containing protein [Halomonas sp.]MDZ7852307.1 GGDEF domain-containing protein [Halomonas sp.]
MTRSGSTLATTDPLTGIANRREFARSLKLEMARANRFHRPLALIMYDLDHFKRINDTFGHNVGDSVLRATTSLVNRFTRQVDLHARWGGEEFTLLLPECSLEAAINSAERLCAAIAEQTFKHKKPVTTSIGVTVLAPEDTIDSLIKRADDVLYRAKGAGRNRVDSEAPEATSTSSK